ncbi:MAG: rhodanese-like domain-containing protein [Flavobacteriaceae bacterium]|nr:rhodanese-like domain-containing protein [Bacteroidota bacterium]MDT8415222.1 rhodanese-like domain-containing protein [Flavobacteriaceae bacterium]
MTDLSSSEWKEKISQDKNALILDVRTPEEIEEGYIPNALHIDIMDPEAFMEGIEDLDPNKNLYVYCRSGRRSAQACMILEQQGFENTFNLIGGILEWDGDVVQD